jgi:TrmH family RNA methyltransferase
VSAHSRRSRKRSPTAFTSWDSPRDAAGEVAALAEGGPEPVALLFGREDRGLSNEALDLCHRIVTIPSDPNYSSLNLAHAVIIMLYELALARGAEAQPFKAPRRPSEPTPTEEIERLFVDVARALREIEFFKTRNADTVMRTMREIAHRMPLDLREVKLLRAIAIEVTKYGERLARSRLHVDR